MKNEIFSVAISTVIFMNMEDSGQNQFRDGGVLWVLYTSEMRHSLGLKGLFV